MKRLTYKQVVEKYGVEVADKALAANVEPTSRMMYPAFEDPNHIGKNEWGGEAIELDSNHTITAYCYLSDEDEKDTDSFDWEANAEFEITETL